MLTARHDVPPWHLAAVRYMLSAFVQYTFTAAACFSMVALYKDEQDEARAEEVDDICMCVPRLAVCEPQINEPPPFFVACAPRQVCACAAQAHLACACVRACVLAEVWCVWRVWVCGCEKRCAPVPATGTR